VRVSLALEAMALATRRYDGLVKADWFFLRTRARKGRRGGRRLARVRPRLGCGPPSTRLALGRAKDSPRPILAWMKSTRVIGSSDCMIGGRSCQNRGLSSGEAARKSCWVEVRVTGIRTAAGDPQRVAYRA